MREIRQDDLAIAYPETQKIRSLASKLSADLFGVIDLHQSLPFGKEKCELKRDNALDALTQQE